MKRTLSIILALMLTISLTACDSYSGGEVNEPSDITTGVDTEEVQQEEKEKEKEVSISETVLVDESGVKITAKSLDTDGFFGSEIKLLIENNSGKDLTFQCRNASVNGYMVGTMMSVGVVNGKKANDGLTFMESDFKACGIEEIADMEISFHIFDTNSWETYLDTDAVLLKTSIADEYEYVYDDSGSLAYEANGLKIVVKGLSEDTSILGLGIVVYIENTGNKDVTVQTRDVSINGFMVDAMFSCNVVAGKRAVDTITFLSSDLEENEITSIEDVELSFHVFNSDSWDTIVDTEVLNITF